MQDSFEDEIRRLLATGNKIAAIKRYREQTGVGLAEAKYAVESLETRSSLTERVLPDESEVTKEIVNLIRRGEKIEAIKIYRQRFGVNLKQAKEAVDRIGVQNGIPSSRTGCFGVLLLATVVVFGLLT